MWPGDVVEVEPTGGHNLVTPVVVFLLPCVGLVAGYLAGQSMGLGEGACLGMAALGVLAGFVPAILMNRIILRRRAPEFSILKSLS